MPNLNKGEFGQVLRADLGEDISTAISYEMILQPQLGETLEKVSTLGTVNIVVDDQTFLANQYIEYTTIEDDLTYAGTWRLKGKAKFANSEVIGDYRKFTVLE